MKKGIISELLHALCGVEGLEILLLVGLKRNSVKGRIDLLAGFDGGSVDKHSPRVKKALKDRWPTGNLFVSDDSVRFDLPTGMGGVAICDSTLLTRQIQEWTGGKNLVGQHRPWATGYWLPEALCGDLATAKNLHDVKGISVQIRKLLVPYPPGLSQAIIDLCVDEIRQKTKTLEGLLEKDNPIESGICVSDITASLVRLTFARSRRYFRGFRSLDDQVKFLRSSDLPIYKLALELSKGERVREVLGKVRRLF